MVCVSIVSIVYNLRMDHYGVRKYRNIENLKYIIREIFYLLLYFVLTNYEAIPTIIRVNVPISPSAPQNPMSDPLTGESLRNRIQFCMNTNI